MSHTQLVIVILIFHKSYISEIKNKNENLPTRSSLPLGFASLNIQPKATAIMPMRTAKKASNDLTP
jgi:hypothetical protein